MKPAIALFIRVCWRGRIPRGGHGCVSHDSWGDPGNGDAASVGVGVRSGLSLDGGSAGVLGSSPGRGDDGLLAQCVMVDGSGNFIGSVTQATWSYTSCRARPMMAILAGMAASAASP